MNRLQQESHHIPSHSAYEGVDSSTQHSQNSFKEWVSVVSDDVIKALLRAAELGCALGEPWLVYNAACSLWNYSHDWVEINEGHLITTCRQLLPIIKQIDIGRYILHHYSGTSIIQTPLDTALMLAYRISEIVRITEVLTFLTEFVGPSL